MLAPWGPPSVHITILLPNNDSYRQNSALHIFTFVQACFKICVFKLQNWKKVTLFCKISFHPYDWSFHKSHGICIKGKSNCILNAINVIWKINVLNVLNKVLYCADTWFNLTALTSTKWQNWKAEFYFSVLHFCSVFLVCIC